MTNIGPYEVVGEIGRGGMGVVSLARDTRLDRQVAIKALPPELAADPGRLERFEREARTLASLNHPNIAGIHGVEEQGDRRYLVLEYVEGETLADRLDRGALPVDEAVEIAVEIARGLEAAHEAGVVHRDLKPANIKVTPAGAVKVLDFGLAKTDDRLSSTGSGLSQSPTLTSPSPQHSPTLPGAILGTAAYMSPEQARGRRVDKRTDIWAFGVILYEMLTGASPFVGETATDSIGAVLHKHVDLSALPPGARSTIARVIGRCVERDKELRYRSVADAALDLLSARNEEAGAPAGSAGGLKVSSVVLVALPIAVLAVVVGWLLGSAGGSSGLLGSTRERVEPPLIVDLSAPEGFVFARRNGPPRLSPDGTKVALVVHARASGSGEDLGPARLCIKELLTGETRVYDDAEGVLYPTWSSDGRTVVYAGDPATLFVLDLVTDGSVAVFSGGEGGFPWGFEWMPDGSLAVAAGRRELLRRDPESGSALEGLSIIDDDLSGGGMAVWPTAIPDGEHYVYTYTGADALDGVYLGAAGSDEQTRLLLSGDTQTRYLPGEGGSPGHLYFTRGSIILRQLLDLERRELVGEAEIVADDAWGSQWPYFTPFDVGPSGRMVYFSAPPTAYENELVFYDVESGVERSSGMTGSLWNPMYSSDDRHLLLDVTTQATAGDIFSIDLRRNYLATNISSDPVNETFPIWVGDDNRMIAFFHDGNLFVADHEGAQRPRVLFDGQETFRPITATPDGSKLLFTRADGRAGEFTFSLYDFETAEETQWLEVPIADARIAPNGDWVLVRTGRPGQRQLELRTFPEGTGRIVIDAGDISSPEWTQDGTQIVYPRDGVLSVVDVRWPEPDGGGGRVGAPTFGEPREILRFRGYREFDVNSDGSEIVLIKEIEPTEGESLRLFESYSSAAGRD